MTTKDGFKIADEGFTKLCSKSSTMLSKRAATKALQLCSKSTQQCSKITAPKDAFKLNPSQLQRSSKVCTKILQEFLQNLVQSLLQNSLWIAQKAAEPTCLFQAGRLGQWPEIGIF